MPLSGTSPLLIIEPERGVPVRALLEARHYGELLYFLVLRELKVRFSQTVLGVAWIAIQPIVLAAVFTIIFGHVVRVSPGALPYPLFALSGLVLWFYFAAATTRAAGSVVLNAGVITKVYFPRVLVPLASILSTVGDFVISLGVLLLVAAFYGVGPQGTLLALPMVFGVAVATALGCGLWLSGLSARYRDVGYLTPLLLQVWLYATPVIYPASLVPERWRSVYALNPMVGTVEGFRWAVTGVGIAPWDLLQVSVAVAVVLLASGALVFGLCERRFADVL